MNTFNAINAAINNDRTMYDAAQALFEASWTLYESRANSECIAWMHEGFARKYTGVIERCFPWLADETDYHGARTVCAALDEMLWEWEQENGKNQ